MEVLLVNAQHIKAVPGRKTDVKDAEWIASLLQHGLLSASFVPPRPQRELRELTRTRKRLIEERSRIANRIQKVLEDTNIKLSSVVTDITGKTARLILDAMLAGEENPQRLAGLARGKLRKKQEELAKAVKGTLRENHRFLLNQHLAHLDFLDKQIKAFDLQIAHCLGIESEPNSSQAQQDHVLAQEEQPAQSAPQGEPVASPQAGANPEQMPEQRCQDHVLAQEKQPTQSPPQGEPAASPQAGANLEQRQECGKRSQPICLQDYRRAIEHLDAVTGINLRVAEVVVAEIGLQMERFPTAEHLASWVGLCPGNAVSAGKRLSGKTTKGNRWLRTALIEAAHGASKSKGTFLGAYYRRLCKRIGKKKAIVALAHRILIIIYHILRDDEPFRELGEQHSTEREQETNKRRAIHRLEQMGYKVQLQQAECA
jgi:transposase